MTTLEQQCEEIRELWINGDSSTWSSGAIKTLIDYIDQLRRPSDATVLIEQAGYKVEELQKLGERLRLLGDSEDGELVAEAAETIKGFLRPSDAKEIAAIQATVAELKQYWAGNPGDVPYNLTRYFEHADILLSALAESQRECARLQQRHYDDSVVDEVIEILEAQGRPEGERISKGVVALVAEIARLQSPPEERRDIQDRQATRKNSRFLDISQCFKDVDTLLEDLRAFRNAHVILLGERDAARDREDDQSRRHTAPAEHEDSALEVVRVEALKSIGKSLAALPWVIGAIAFVLLLK